MCVCVCERQRQRQRVCDRGSVRMGGEYEHIELLQIFRLMIHALRVLILMLKSSEICSSRVLCQCFMMDLCSEI